MQNLLFLVIFLLVSLHNQAQTTAIPDPYFEQALIDLQIDSDGQLNGQVLTADISTLSVLEISGKGIQDLTGIAAFSALEILNCTDNNLSALDLNANAQLKELYAGNPGELPENTFSSLDLSNNNLLEIVELENIPALEFINLKNGNNTILSQVKTTCFIEGAACNNALCIEVDNAQAANNNQAPYSSWASGTGVAYAEDCNLKVTGQAIKTIKFFPNPTTGKVFLTTKKNNIQKLQIFGMEGKLLQEISFKDASEFSLEQHPAGIYFIKYWQSNTFKIQKIIKR